MSTADPAHRGFEALAREVRSFERTLLWLVTGSFVLSGISSFARASAFASSKVAMVTLVGTIAGCFAVVSTHLGWPQRPEEQISETIMFDPGRKAFKVRFYFFLSLVFLIAYAELPEGSEWVALACDALAIYFFFGALVTSTLAARAIDNQQALWSRLDETGRQYWLAHRKQQFEADQNLRKLHEESTQLIQEIKTTIEGTKARRRAERRLRAGWDATVGRLYRWSVDLRHRIAPNDWLLTKSERAQREADELQSEKVWRELEEQWAREDYDLIRSGKMRSFRNERTGRAIFRKNGLRYMIVESDISEESARLLVEELSGFRDTNSGRLGAINLFIDAGARITEQGRITLVENGIKLYWPADWRRDEAAATNAELTTDAVRSVKTEELSAHAQSQLTSG